MLFFRGFTTWSRAFWSRRSTLIMVVLYDHSGITPQRYGNSCKSFRTFPYGIDMVPNLPSLTVTVWHTTSRVARGFGKSKTVQNGLWGVTKEKSSHRNGSAPWKHFRYTR